MEEKFIDIGMIKLFFDELNKSEIEYVLIKNIDKELPECLPNGKDIDIVVKDNDIDCFENMMKTTGFECMVHPLGISKGYQFLYGLTEPTFWRMTKGSMILCVDVTTKLCCKSLVPKTWIPLDRKIQERIWHKREWDNENHWWIMDAETRFVYYLVRCIFDKQCFDRKYVGEIEHAMNLVDMQVVRTLLRVIFFKYTDRLLEFITEKRYNEIYLDYVSYRNY